MRSYTHIIHPQSLSKNKDPHHNKSVGKNNNKQASTSEESTNPQPNLKAPRPVLQTKITKTHANLVQIPIPYRPELIEQLYLSHNNISSVKNKLRVFVSLRNLNLSYNLLTDLGQFVNEILGNTEVGREEKQLWAVDHQEQKLRETGKIELKMLYIRMNRFAYGYQDEIIRMIDTLERFEDFNLTRNSESTNFNPKTKDSQAENPKQIFQIAHKVSEYFLPSYSNLLSSIKSLTAIHTLLFQQQSQSLLSSITSSSISGKYERAVSKLSTLLQPKKQTKYMPCSRKTALLNILEFEMICIEVQEQFSGLQLNIAQKNDVFKGIVKEILMIYNNRNNYQLLKTLQDSYKSKNKEKQLDLNDLNTLSFLFGQMYKATRHTIYEPNPGKYLSKIDPNSVKEHPFLQYMNYNNQKQKQERKLNSNNFNTLDGNRRRTKNTMLRQLAKFVPKEHDKNKDSLDFQEQTTGNNIQPIYENMPIIVYERNYLQIIQQIWEIKLKNFIKIYDLVFRKLKQVQQNIHNPLPKFVSFQINQKQDGKTIPVPRLPAEVYLEDNETIGNSRVCNRQNVVSEFKNTQIENRRKTSSYILVEEQKEKQNVQKSQENKKTLPKFGSFTEQNKKQRKKPSRKDNIIQIQNDILTQVQQQYKQNLSKYSIYEINLAYKVLTALKKNKNKAKRARAKVKANPESSRNQSYNATEKTKKIEHKNSAAKINQFTFKSYD